VISIICERKMAKRMTLYKVIVSPGMCPDKKKYISVASNILLFCNTFTRSLKRHFFFLSVFPDFEVSQNLRG
jgi:hypothetical protein